MAFKAAAKWVLKKILVGLNTAFFGYEVGNFLEDDEKHETFYNTTIIQAAPAQQQDDAHFYVVIGFLFLIVVLLCLSWVLKVVIKVKTNRGNNQIELTAIPATNNV